MQFRLPLLPTLTTLAAIAATTGWQYYELQEHRDRHLLAHRRHAEALWNAVDGLAVREFRGGQYSPSAVEASLTESQQRFGLQWVAIESDSGTTLASAGVLPGRALPDFWIEGPFAPLRPKGLGPRLSAHLREAPDEPLTLQIALDPEPLTAGLHNDVRRMVVTSCALALVIALVAFAAASRARRLRLHSKLAASQERLQGLEMMRRLGAGLVHETKNPLGVVRGLAERIGNASLEPAELQQTVRAIVDEADRTVARLDEFLLLSRPAKLRRSAVALDDLFGELAQLLRADFERVGANLEVLDGGMTIDADREQLRRLLMNLLLNASQAVGAGDTVELFARASDQAVIVGVQDDGPGVPEDLRQTLFEPYVSGRQGGTGLGLAIARRIANDHGFTLRYEPRLPHGTCMLLEVPA